MPDILIRDVPIEVVAALDAAAARQGMSRSEYLRRRLAQDASTDKRVVTVEDLRRSAGVFADLDDPAVSEGAWS